MTKCAFVCPVAAVACGVLALVTGCTTPPANVTLYQPFAPRSQQELHLASSWAYSEQRDGRQRLLLAFPLPGAEDGPRDFLIFLTAPDQRGAVPIDAASPEAAQGFLIQAVGELRGRTVFSSGEFSTAAVPLQSGRYELELDVACADGTRITGRAIVSVAPHEVRSFEQRYAADIAAVEHPSAPATQATASQPATELRSSSE